MAGTTGRFQFQIQIQSYQGRERLGPKDIDNILPGRLISLGREESGLLSLAGLLADGELDARLDASILTQNSNNPVPLPLDISLQFLSSHWEVIEEIFDYDSGSLLCRHHARSFQLPRHLEFELGALRRILCLTCYDREMRECAERG